MIVTIDGPAGTGKSSVARALAQMLGFQFLDTGAMYRMVAWRTVVTGTDPGDHRQVEELTSASRMELIQGTILLDGVDVSGELRTAEVTCMASIVAQIPQVRELLVRRQRDIANSHDIVCEGRDQGTVAFPHAECKFFLTAQADERARRRLAELLAQGQETSFELLLKDQQQRDQRDAQRKVAPLRPADDAEMIDTTELSLQEVVELLHRKILEKQSRPG